MYVHTPHAIICTKGSETPYNHGRPHKFIQGGARLDSKRNVAIGESVKLVCSFNRRICCCMDF
jgi:hypothetical protein